MATLQSRLQRLEQSTPTIEPLVMPGGGRSPFGAALVAVERLGREGARRWLLENGIDWADKCLDIIENV